MSCVTSQSTCTDVQSYMNAIEGNSKWRGRNAVWALLLLARKQFIKDQLKEIGLTPWELKHLREIQRYRHIAQFEEAFVASFFAFSRDNDWMQMGVGENDGWIKLDGMAAWHVRGALATLQRDTERAASNSAPFDPVKDAIKNGNK